MEEIKVGEYIRTNKGIIGKIKSTSDLVIEKDGDGNVLYYGYVKHIGYPLPQIDIEKIEKHRPNIIDLMKVGDYVNGEKVIKILDGFIEGTMELKLSNNKKIYRTNTNEIKSIVTKEQYESIKYEVE